MSLASSPLLTAAVRLIRDAYGESTAELFRTRYDGRPDDVILVSVRRLLEDAMGPARASMELERLTRLRSL